MTLPGSIVEDLRNYAQALKFPSNWATFINVLVTDGGINGRGWHIKYKGEPLVDYRLDILNEIEDAKRHVPIPEAPEPLVTATRCAISQPTDDKWRRFKHLVFRIEDVVWVNGVDPKTGHENGNAFSIMFRNGKELHCGNEQNYEGTGQSTCEFFIEHILGVSPKSRQHQP